jgi:hypothetical protein
MKKTQKWKIKVKNKIAGRSKDGLYHKRFGRKRI